MKTAWTKVYKAQITLLIFYPENNLNPNINVVTVKSYLSVNHVCINRIIYG